MPSYPLYPTALSGRTIRLLHVLPGEEDSPIQCKLSLKDLDDNAETYFALSYVWGSSTDRQRTTCNGHVTMITTNLHSLLLEFRRRGMKGNDLDTPLWIDALCINQSDDVERTTQVRMMQDIYKRAEVVIIWLGPMAPRENHIDIQTLTMINAPWKRHMGVPSYPTDSVASFDMWLAQRLTDENFTELAKFLQTPWFQRIWVVQELLSAREVRVWRGNMVFDENDILEGAYHITLLHNISVRLQIGVENNSNRVQIECAGLLEKLRETVASGEQLNMLSLLLATRPLQATDRRDKIFALVGLASDVDESFVDYGKDIKDIVTELSRMFLSGKLESTTSPLDYLSYITRPDGEREDLPSWVVEWTLFSERSLFVALAGAYPSEPPYVTDSPILHFEDDKTLIIRGALIARISHTISSPPCMSHQIPIHELLTLSAVASYVDWHMESKALASLIDAYPTGESTHDAYWRTLMCNRATALSQDAPKSDAAYYSWTCICIANYALMQGVETIKHRHRWAHGASVALAAVCVAGTSFFWPRLPKWKIFIPLLAPGTYSFLRNFAAEVRRLALLKLHGAYMHILGLHEQGQQEFENAFSQWCQGRKFALFENGYMGWVPSAARVGDVGLVWRGCRVPFVVREDIRREGWRVLGDAYVHGWMDGVEFGEGVEEEDIRIT